jgi:hypothetical protein
MYFTSVHVNYRCYRPLKHIFSSLEGEVPVHIIIAHREVGYNSTHYEPQHLMGVSGQFHALVSLPSWKEPWSQFEGF